MRRIWLTFVLFGLGCQQTFTVPAAKSWADPVAPSPVAPSQPVAPLPGQLSATGTLKDLEKNAVAQAAALAAQKTEAEASTLLREFLARYPDRCEARKAYGDLLLQMRQPSEARVQYEELLEHCQDDRPDRAQLMMHAHSQLAEIAVGRRDAYAEHLHRGVGYYLLARSFKAVGVGGTIIPSKSLLDKAQSELTQAIEMRPQEAQPCWYISGVCRAQGQNEAAERFLRLAKRCAAQSHLTTQERRGIDSAMKSLRP